MASPQCEDGYTRIANELLLALCRSRLTLYEWRVLMAVIRLTYGYNRKVDQISVRQLSRITSINYRLVYRTLKSLEKKNMLHISKQKNRLILGIQKDYERWDVISTDNTMLSEEITTGVISGDNIKSSEEITNLPSKTAKKDNYNNGLSEDAPFSKDNIKDSIKDSIKDNRSACIADLPPSPMSQLFLEVIKRYPEFDVRDDDMRWFEERVEGNSTYRELDLKDELHNWEDWLETEHRKKERKKANKFPRSNFKSSLLNWLKKAMEIKENQKHKGGHYEDHIPSWRRKKGRKGFDLPSDYPIDAGGPDEET